MRIKFLSIIASFFMVSCVITSCLDDDTNIEYSSDATIHAFALDTIGYGKTYKFTIDQLKREIYNEDSIPVHADTIVDRILIKTLTTASGLVTMRNKADTKDSIVNINDSIDLSKYINPTSTDNKYLKLTVWAPDGLQKKEYSISIRKHLQDPDSLNWGNNKREKPMPFKSGFSSGEVIGKQKAIILNEKIIVYSFDSNNQLIAHRTDLADGKNWESLTIQGIDNANQLDMSSIIEYSGKLYMVTNSSVYWSENGTDWRIHPQLNRNGFKFATLITAIQPNQNQSNIADAGIFGIASEDNGTTYRFCATESNAISWTLKDIISNNFPTRNISSTVGIAETGVPFIIAMGASILREDTKKEPIIPWSTYDGLSWVDLSTSDSSSCPMLQFPSIFYYNQEFYSFGNDFGVFYTSPSGLTWKEANKKFYFPENLKNRKGADYSIVIDKNQFIWIICSKDKIGSGTDDIWRGRLNKLGFKKN